MYIQFEITKTQAYLDVDNMLVNQVFNINNSMTLHLTPNQIKVNRIAERT